MNRFLITLVTSLALLCGQAGAAINASCIWEIQTTGADTNGGGFSPNSSNFVTNLAATSATGNSPLVTSATFNFVAGDVGAWLYIKSGTNWTPGWYQIASVASNAATLSAAVGQAYSNNGNFDTLNTAAGCATVASPTSGTGSIDYTLTPTVCVNVADGVTAASTTITSVTAAFHKGMIGNVIYIEGGTAPITATRREITAVASATSITVDAALSGVSTGTTLKVGGALQSPALAAGFCIAGNDLWLKSGTYTISSASSNVANGRLTMPNGVTGGANQSKLRGYNATRGDLTTAVSTNRPVLQATTSMSGAAVVTAGTTGNLVENVTVDGNSQTTTLGFGSAAGATFSNCKAMGCTTGFSIANVGWLRGCEATTCSVSGFTVSAGAYLWNCNAHDNTATGFSLSNVGSAMHCISESNSGATSDGFALSYSSGGGFVSNCTAYNNGRHGFYVSGGGSYNDQILNSVATGHAAGYGFSASGVKDSMWLINPATYDNASGGVNLTNLPSTRNAVTLTGDPFVGAAAGNFAPNATAGAGALLRAASIMGAAAGDTSTGYLDIGAVQHQDSGGGGGVQSSRAFIN